MGRTTKHQRNTKVRVVSPNIDHGRVTLYPAAVWPPPPKIVTL